MVSWPRESDIRRAEKNTGQACYQKVLKADYRNTYHPDTNRQLYRSIWFPKCPLALLDNNIDFPLRLGNNFTQNTVEYTDLGYLAKLISRYGKKKTIDLML